MVTEDVSVSLSIWFYGLTRAWPSNHKDIANREKIMIFFFLGESFIAGTQSPLCRVCGAVPVFWGGR